MSPNEGPPNGILVGPNKFVKDQSRFDIHDSRICSRLPKFRLGIIRLETLRIREKIISIEMGFSVTLYIELKSRLVLDLVFLIDFVHDRTNFCKDRGQILKTA